MRDDLREVFQSANSLGKTKKISAAQSQLHRKKISALKKILANDSDVIPIETWHFVAAGVTASHSSVSQKISVRVCCPACSGPSENCVSGFRSFS
jgi:hypothetical protein